MGNIPVPSLYTMSSSQNNEGALHGLHGTGKCWRLSRDMQMVQFGSWSGYAYFDVGSEWSVAICFLSADLGKCEVHWLSSGWLSLRHQLMLEW